MKPLMIPDLFARRSIRQYTGEPVSQEQIDTLLQAAMAAPSARNEQPWEFIVITDPAVLKAISEVHANARMVLQAGLAIVPCGVPARGPAAEMGFWIDDVSAATENLLLAATALGLGAVWCGVYPYMERVAGARRVLGIPEDVIPLAFVAVGHPAEVKEAHTKYDPARVHRNGW